MTADPDRTIEREDFTEHIERSIKAALREFQELEIAQMRKGRVEARARLARVKRDVDAKRTAAQRKLHRVRKATSAAWEEAKAEAETAWRELRDAVEQARDELSNGGPAAGDGQEGEDDAAPGA